MGKIIRVTMTDVGRSAGVSQAAVSLALRNEGCIPPATRERIRAMARELGYQRHAGISSLTAQIRSKRPVKFRATLASVTDWPDPGEFRNSKLAPPMGGCPAARRNWAMYSPTSGSAATG